MFFVEPFAVLFECLPQPVRNPTNSRQCSIAMSVFVALPPFRENAPKFCAPICAHAARSRCDLPSPRPADRIRLGLRTVCRRLRPWCRLEHETHRNAPLSRSKGRGVYPNPRRRKNVALKGCFCVGLLPAPGAMVRCLPLPELPPLPSCPPRCCPAAAPLPLPELPDVPCCPGATFGMECDDPLGSGPDQTDQTDQTDQKVGTVTKSWHTNGLCINPTNPTKGWYGHQVLAHQRVMHQPDQPDDTSHIVFTRVHPSSLRTYALNKGSLVGLVGSCAKSLASYELVTN